MMGNVNKRPGRFNADITYFMLDSQTFKVVELLRHKVTEKSITILFMHPWHNFTLDCEEFRWGLGQHESKIRRQDNSYEVFAL